MKQIATHLTMTFIELVGFIADVSRGVGLVSKVLLANAGALCAPASPLMDPEETLL
jgi:hypothetical protein